MLTDIQIANSIKIKPITEIAQQIGIKSEDLELYGNYKAKISEDYIKSVKDKSLGKLILVTAINPTPAGEGKTTVTVGLGQAMGVLKKNAVVCLREPSLGPVFGIKGGAAGGGYSQVLPMEDINLHFTGDLHAITAANNLLCALIDNHIHQGNELKIDYRRILFKRCMDMNDRALREAIVGLGGKINGYPREDGFQITVASEIMAILCLSNDISDLKQRLGNILVAYSLDNEPIYAHQLKAHGAMAVLLKDAIKPNLVQTIEGTPVIMHGGPFANIAHGCNSIRATSLALKSADYCITEAGFGSDLGAEKFFDIKCRVANLKPNAVVVVATTRALKYNGGLPKSEAMNPNIDALKNGIANLGVHIDNMKSFGLPVVVAINKFETDKEDELNYIKSYCEKREVAVAICDVFAKGGQGGVSLAEKVIKACEKENCFNYKYDVNDTIENKIKTIANKIYHANNVEFTSKARKSILQIEKLQKACLPICIAKTQYSLSDDPTLLGCPKDFTVTVQDVKLLNGAGFIVVYLGDIMTMPGLPKVPAANNIDIDDKGIIKGLF